MTTTQMINLNALHTAHLDPVAGVGLLVCPDPDRDDVFLSWRDDAVKALFDQGWSPVEDEYGMPADPVAALPHGGSAVLLVGKQEPALSLSEEADAQARLLELLDVA